MKGNDVFLGSIFNGKCYLSDGKPSSCGLWDEISDNAYILLSCYLCIDVLRSTRNILEREYRITESLGGCPNVDAKRRRDYARVIPVVI